MDSQIQRTSRWEHDGWGLERGRMNIAKYLKNEKFSKYIMSTLLFLIIMIVAGMFVVKAEDNKTKEIMVQEWTTQLIYDTTNACYEGTLRWIVMINPSLINIAPGPVFQRQMLTHCFCVMDKIKKDIKITEYRNNIFNQEWIGNLFMTRAIKCVKEERTLSSFFVYDKGGDIKSIPIPKGKIDNSVAVPDEEAEDSKEESPDQQQEESEGLPQTIFQG